MAEVDALVEELCGSLGRACEVFYSPVVRDTDDGKEVFFRIHDGLMPKVSSCLRVYTRRYWRSKGYALKKLTVGRGVVSMLVKHEPREPRPERRRTHE